MGCTSTNSIFLSSQNSSRGNHGCYRRQFPSRDLVAFQREDSFLRFLESVKQGDGFSNVPENGQALESCGGGGGGVLLPRGDRLLVGTQWAEGAVEASRFGVIRSRDVAGWLVQALAYQIT